MGILSFNVDAYTAKYYFDDSVNVLLEHKDYILDNFRELEVLFDIFVNNMVVVDDVKRENSILSKNGIIIDPDCFFVSNYSKDFITIPNKKELLNLLRSLCAHSARGQSCYGKLVTWICTELVDIDVIDKTDITYEISKKLSYVKKPIDIIG